jgi:hypothetical protein
VAIAAKPAEERTDLHLPPMPLPGGEYRDGDRRFTADRFPDGSEATGGDEGGVENLRRRDS